MRALTKNLIKAGAALAAVEATVYYGIFRDNNRAYEGVQEARESFLGRVMPPLKPYLDKVPLPHYEVPQVDVREYWNRGVLYTFSSLDALPGKIGHGLSIGWNKIKEAATAK